MLVCLPYVNSVERVEVNGTIIRLMLEQSVSTYESDDPSGRFLQFSGIRQNYP